MIPRGIEILVKKASIDDEFKDTLLTERSHAARRIGLRLYLTEKTMLDTFPETQLDKIIDGTKVDSTSRPAFLGYAATAMLAALVGGSVASAAGEGGGFAGEITSDGLSVDDKSFVIEGCPDILLSYAYYGETGIRPEVAVMAEAFGNLLTMQYDENGVAGRSRDYIGSALEAVLQGPISDFYEKEREINEDAGLGEIVVQFKITKEGRITDFEVISDEVNAPRVLNSIRDNLNTIEMKPASSDVRVVYSFYLSLIGDA